MNKTFWVFIVIILTIGLLYILFSSKISNTLKAKLEQNLGNQLNLPANNNKDLNYVPAEQFEDVLQIETLASTISQLTHLEITSDGQYMFVATLPGDIYLFHKVDGKFVIQEQPFYRLQTGQAGFPPDEAGLTGIILAPDFDQSQELFLTYSYAELQVGVEKDEKVLKNRVAKIKFESHLKYPAVISNGAEFYPIVNTADPEIIFEANTPGGPSHQIQDGIGIMINSLPHIMFTVGEGFSAERALNTALEAGKVILIQTDGSIAAGSRPFLQAPKVQALGIRNAPAMAYNVEHQKVAILDTGPSANDRFIYGHFFDPTGKQTFLLSLNWDGSNESLEKSIPDLYTQNNSNMNIFRWTPTETGVNVAFYRNEKLPELAKNQQYVLVTLFGQTGTTLTQPGKKLLLGTLTHNADQDKIDFQDFIVRAKLAEGKSGNPIGLAVDPQTNEIYFGDILEGKIYKVSFK